jgi:hypothetical protein
MAGTLSPDQRPAGLGTADTGFRFQTTDTLELYRWNGTAWVNQTPANAVQLAVSGGSLTLSPTTAQIPGTAIVLNRAGRYLITGNFTYNVAAGDTGVVIRAGLNANGAAAGNIGLLVVPGTGIFPLAQQWLYTAGTAGQTIYLTASKDSGSGTSATRPETCITALWIGP